MQMIRTYKYRMLRRMGYWLTTFILLMAAVAVFADKPPDQLFKHVTGTAQLVHNGTCDVASMKVKNIECLIFYNAPQQVIWIVLFDKDKSKQPQVSHVIAVVHDTDKIVWCRQDVCA